MILAATADALEHVDGTVLLVRKGLEVERVVLVLGETETPAVWGIEVAWDRGTAIMVDELLLHIRAHVLE